MNCEREKKEGRREGERAEARKGDRERRKEKKGNGKRKENLRGSCCFGLPGHFHSAPVPARHTLCLPPLTGDGHEAHSGEPGPDRVDLLAFLLKSPCPVHPLLSQISFGSLTEISEATRWARVTPMAQMPSLIRLFLEQRLGMAFGEEGLRGRKWEAHGRSPLRL